MEWAKACDASVNNKAKRDEGEETWLIVDRSSSQVSYDVNHRKPDNRQEGPRGPVARVIVNAVTGSGEATFRTKKMIDITTIEKYDDWRPSVPRPIVEEVNALEELAEELSNETNIEELNEDDLIDGLSIDTAKYIDNLLTEE